MVIYNGEEVKLSEKDKLRFKLIVEIRKGMQKAKEAGVKVGEFDPSTLIITSDPSDEQESVFDLI